MKTKLLVLFTAALTLASVTSCAAPYGYGNSYSRSSRYSHHRGGSGYRHPSRNDNMGGYRGGGAGGGIGGSFGGFNR